MRKLAFTKLRRIIGDVQSRLARHARLERAARIANAVAWFAFGATLVAGARGMAPVVPVSLAGAFVIAAAASIVLRRSARRALS